MSTTQTVFSEFALYEPKDFFFVIDTIRGIYKQISSMKEDNFVLTLDQSDQLISFGVVRWYANSQKSSLSVLEEMFNTNPFLKFRKMVEVSGGKLDVSVGSKSNATYYFKIPSVDFRSHTRLVRYQFHFDLGF